MLDKIERRFSLDVREKLEVSALVVGASLNSPYERGFALEYEIFITFPQSSVCQEALKIMTKRVFSRESLSIRKIKPWWPG